MKMSWLVDMPVTSRYPMSQSSPSYFVVSIDDDWCYDVDIFHVAGNRFRINRIDRPDLADEMRHPADGLLPYIRAGWCFQVGSKQGQGYILMTHPMLRARQRRALAGVREVRSALLSARYGPNKEQDRVIVERLERIACYLTNRYIRLLVEV